MNESPDFKFQMRNSDNLLNSEANRKKNKKHDEFKNKIFIDKDHEQDLINDFDDLESINRQKIMYNIQE